MAQGAAAVATPLVRTSTAAADAPPRHDEPRVLPARASADALMQIALDDLVASVGCAHRPLVTRILRWCLQRPARTFARQMVEFDAAVAQLGLPGAARRAQRHYVRDVQVSHERPLPVGPVLALANHPGMTDTLSLFSALDRDDLKIIALDRPFLTAMPHVSDRLFFVRESDSRARAQLVRQVSTHLRRGGSVLTFPAGHIEPDPAVAPDAIASLDRWTDSVGVFIRMAPDTAVVPVLVRGVLWRAALRQPLLRLKQTREERERLAATLQLLAHVAWGIKPVTVRVHVGAPISARELGTTDARVIHAAVVAGMRRLHAASLGAP